MKYPSGKNDKKKLKKIIQQLLLICYMLEKMNKYPAYVSKHNLNHEKQIILIMFPNGKE